MKKLIGIVFSSMLLVVVVVCSYSVIIEKNMEQRILSNNPEIEHISNVTRIGKWGEWNSEYVVEAKIKNQSYRIWFNNNGEMTDKILLK